MPCRLQLVCLGGGGVLGYAPVEVGLRVVGRKLLVLWEAIRWAVVTGDWRPRPGRLCDWCPRRALCPAWGGIPPPCPLATVTGPAVEYGERPAAGAR